MYGFLIAVVRVPIVDDTYTQRHKMERFIDYYDEEPVGYTEPASADPQEELVHALVALRIVYLSHQNSHWQADGESYYGDHLLMQRLYESVQGDVDALAERIVGLYGKETIDLEVQLATMSDCSECNEFSTILDGIERAVAVEQHALAMIEEAYSVLESNGTKTLGLDDLLTAIASNRETSLYLLGQRE